MPTRQTVAVVAGTALLAAWLIPARAEELHRHPAPPEGVASALSPALAALLSEEMLAIQGGLGALVVAMAAGDWPLVAETGEKIENSYILARRLTPEQVAELERVLPARFKALDAAFHGSAGKLARAARARDAELAVFHSYKLMEACVECHATYAGERFPGFGAQEPSHEH